MPWKKKYKKRRKKFGVRKNNKTVSLVMRQPSLMPDELLVRFTYDGNFDLGAQGPAFTGFVIAGNNINQIVNGQGAPNRALGAEQMAPFYNNFQVLSSKLHIDYQTDYDPASKISTQVGVVPINGLTNLPSSFNQAMQQPYSKKLLLSEVQAQSESTDSSMSSKKILGYHGPIDDLEATQGPLNATGNPVSVWNWHVFAEPRGAGNWKINCAYKIHYYCRLFRRKILPAAST